jgi:hypothetical protein
MNGPSFLLAAALALASPAASQCLLSELTASDGEPYQQFGWSVAMHADRALVGAPLWGGQPTTGFAHVYERVGAGWVEVARLAPADTDGSVQFGHGVALHGETALVGARFAPGSAPSGGAAYVFERVAATWVQTGKLVPSQPAINVGAEVALDGDTAVLGAAGGPCVFERGPTGWTQTAKLLGSDSLPEDLVMPGVDVDGDTIVVGAERAALPPFEEVGAAYVFERAGGSWVQTAKLSPPNPVAGQNFGRRVAISGNTTIVASDDGTFFFERGAAGWAQVAFVQPTLGDLGRSVDVSGTTALLSEPVVGLLEGAVRVYQRIAGVWEQTAVIPAQDPASQGDHFGSDVAIDGGTALVGAKGVWDGGQLAGAAYAFGLSLCGDVAEIPLAAGGTQTLSLAAGGAHAGAPYLLLGSLSGTSPGIALGALVLPLEPDAYLLFTLKHPGAPPLAGSAGLLDATGAAAASFAVPPGLPAALVGLTAYHAFAALDAGAGAVAHVSNAVGVELVP